MKELVELSNGIKVVFENLAARNSITSGIYLPIGSRLENEQELGYSHFTEHMLFKGTAKRSYKEISREIDRLGGYMNASTSKEITNYYITLSPKFIETGLDVLSDMFFNSTFLKNEFNTEQKVIIEEIKMGEDNPDEYLFDLFYEDIFGDSPVGRNIAGSIKSIADSSRDRLFNYYTNKYGPNGAVLSLAGALWSNDSEKKALITLIERYFNKDKVNLKGKPNFREISKGERLIENKLVHHEKELEQVHFAMGLPGTSLLDEDDAAIKIFNHLMGGSMSSRLFRKLREENGFCYSVGTFHSRYFKEGIWGVYCGTSKKYFNQAVSLAYQEIQKAFSEGVSEEEIKDSQSGICGSLELSMESTHRHASFNARSLLYYNELRDWQDEISKIEKMHHDDVLNEVKALWQNSKISFSSLGVMAKEETEKFLQDTLSSQLIA